MIPWLTPSMIASCASGTFTFRSTCPRVAPNAAAASTVFASTTGTAKNEPVDARIDRGSYGSAPWPMVMTASPNVA